ncbi:MAG TPA: hypothetical protein VHE35_10155, partial [Kofleriaceae bacterium]|nr:hypothetical protein [Kofleriaceae bacterium]
EPAAPAPERAADRARARASSAPQGATGKKRPAEQRKANKGKFRETLWFKKGDLDAAAAAEAARSKDASVQDKSDTLPMEERYVDDGSVTSNDAARYSLKTGNTSSMPALQGGDEDDADRSRVSEDELVADMKRGRRKIMLAIAVGAVILGAIIAAFAL